MGATTVEIPLHVAMVSITADVAQLIKAAAGAAPATHLGPLITVEQGIAVADWVSTTGKNLTTVFVTHEHGDHWFGRGAVRERFPRRAGRRYASSRRGHAQDCVHLDLTSNTHGRDQEILRLSRGGAPAGSAVRRAPVSEEVLDATWALRVPTGRGLAATSCLGQGCGHAASMRL